MEKITTSDIVMIILGVIYPIMAFFIKYYFKQINTEIEQLTKRTENLHEEQHCQQDKNVAIQAKLNTIADNLAYHSGKAEMLYNEVRDNTIEMVKLRSEVNAVWRFIDHKARATDLIKEGNKNA